MRMQVWSLVSLNGLRIPCCCELQHRSQTHLDPALLWLWHRPEAAAPIRPLAWELKHGTGMALKKKKRKKKKKKTKKPEVSLEHHHIHLWSHFLWSCSCYNSRVKTSGQDLNIYYLPLYRKSLPSFACQTLDVKFQPFNNFRRRWVLFLSPF